MTTTNPPSCIALPSGETDETSNPLRPLLTSGKSNTPRIIETHTDIDKVVDMDTDTVIETQSEVDVKVETEVKSEGESTIQQQDAEEEEREEQEQGIDLSTAATRGVVDIDDIDLGNH